jgi:hypothetical protein
MSANISFSSRVVIPDTVLNLDTESYLGLDPVGTRMWNVLTEQSSIEAAYQVLLSEYDVAPETLRADIERLLGDMLEHKLIMLRDE